MPVMPLAAGDAWPAARISSTMTFIRERVARPAGGRWQDSPVHPEAPTSIRAREPAIRYRDLFTIRQYCRSRQPRLPEPIPILSSSALTSRTESVPSGDPEIKKVTFASPFRKPDTPKDEQAENQSFINWSSSPLSTISINSGNAPI